MSSTPLSPQRASTIEILGLAMLGLAIGDSRTLFQRLVLVRASARFDTDTLTRDNEAARAADVVLRDRRIGDIERRLGGVREIRRIVIEQGSKPCRLPLRPWSG